MTGRKGGEDVLDSRDVNSVSPESTRPYYEASAQFILILYLAACNTMLFNAM